MTIPDQASPLPARAGGRPATLARARLLLGIAAVGTYVIAAAVVLLFDLAPRVASADRTGSLASATLTVTLVLAAVLVAGSPFDLIGGTLLVRSPERTSRWIVRWLRGVAVQVGVFALVALLLMGAVRAFDRWAAVALFVVIQLVLAHGRGRLARLAASLRTARLSAQQSQELDHAAGLAGIARDRIVVMSATDEAFTGGWEGLSPRRLVLPLAWLALPSDLLTSALARREVIATSGAHRRGIFAATLWNATGFVVVLLTVVGDLGSAAGALEVAAGMTLWSFAGVLLLPSIARGAVYAVDARVARRGDAASLAGMIAQSDRWQDDEPERARGIETIFHPVPAANARIRRVRDAASDAGSWVHASLHAADGQIGAYHVARHALFMSWGALSPLGRAVHCNVGRPALLVMLPSD